MRPGLELDLLVPPSDEAAVSHRAAGYTYGLDAIPELIAEFSVPHGVRAPNAYQRRRFDQLEVVEFGARRITSVRQTLADLGAVLDPDSLERAVESALRKGLVDELDLRDFAYIYVWSRHGAPAIREMLDRRPIGAPPTGSDVETICLQVYRRGGVPTPERQWRIYAPDGELVGVADFGWPAKRFGTEVDRFETHGTYAGLQYDLNRANRIHDVGVSLRRFTYVDVSRRPRYVCRETLTGLRLAG